MTHTAAAPRVRVRPLTPSDRDLIARSFDGLSPISRLLRFLAPMPRLPRRIVIAEAAERGVERLTFDIDEHNVAATALVAAFGVRSRYEDGPRRRARLLPILGTQTSA